MSDLQNRNIIQLLRTSGSTVPLNGEIIKDNGNISLKCENITVKDGELILAMDNDHPRIFFLKNNGEFAEFVDKKEIVRNEYVISKAFNDLHTAIRTLRDAMGDGFINTTLTDRISELEDKHGLKTETNDSIGGLDLFLYERNQEK